MLKIALKQPKRALTGCFSHQAGFAAEGTETGTPFLEVNLLEKVCA